MILKHKLQALSEIGALHGTGPSPELIIPQFPMLNSTLEYIVDCEKRDNYVKG